MEPSDEVCGFALGASAAAVARLAVSPMVPWSRARFAQAMCLEKIFDRDLLSAIAISDGHQLQDGMSAAGSQVW